MTLSIMALSIMTLSILTLSIMTLSILTLSILTISMTILSITMKNASIRITKLSRYCHYAEVLVFYVMLGGNMPNYNECLILRHYAGCRYAKCLHTEFLA